MVILVHFPIIEPLNTSSCDVDLQIATQICSSTLHNLYSAFKNTLSEDLILE